MPAFITHYLYGVDLYHSIASQPIRKTLRDNIHAFRLGLQGPDIYFYHPLMVFRRKEHNLGSVMHRFKVSEFFCHYLKNLDDLSKKDSEIAFAYLCGLIAHNTLDGAVHPYVYYKSKYDPDSNIPSEYFFGMHGEIETCMDYLMLQKVRNLRPSQFHSSKTIHLAPTELKVLSNILSKSICDTYGKDNRFLHVKPHFIRESIFSTKFALSALHSRKGVRKKVLSFLEAHLLHYHVVAPTINWDGMIDSYDVMNEKREHWYNPWKKELISNESFDELYEKAKDRFLHSLPLLYDYLLANKVQKKAKRKPLLKELGNVSYHSGLSCLK